MPLDHWIQAWWAENNNTIRKPYDILWADCSFHTCDLRKTQINRDKRPVIQGQRHRHLALMPFSKLI